MSVFGLVTIMEETHFHGRKLRLFGWYQSRFVLIVEVFLYTVLQFYAAFYAVMAYGNKR